MRAPLPLSAPLRADEAIHCSRSGGSNLASDRHVVAGDKTSVLLELARSPANQRSTKSFRNGRGSGGATDRTTRRRQRLPDKEQPPCRTWPPIDAPSVSSSSPSPSSSLLISEALLLQTRNDTTTTRENKTHTTKCCPERTSCNKLLERERERERD